MHFPSMHLINIYLVQLFKQQSSTNTILLLETLIKKKKINVRITLINGQMFFSLLFYFYFFFKP